MLCVSWTRLNHWMANHCLSNDFKDALHWRQIIAISKIWMIVHHIMENMTIKCFVNIKLSNFLGFRGLVGGWLLQMGAGWRKAINRSLYSSSSPAHLPSSTSVANNSRSNIQNVKYGSKTQDLRFNIEDLRSLGGLIQDGWGSGAGRYLQHYRNTRPIKGPCFH